MASFRHADLEGTMTMKEGFSSFILVVINNFLNNPILREAKTYKTFLPFRRFFSGMNYKIIK